ncbi:hypothetical protein ACHAWO_002626 [Cyclotella atomus]|uniref:Transmembrane protein 65 n=1 Tax=Cyclotella atomus TaxID=382360 RepID=A0ABD3NH76_9STRA
MLSFIPAVTSHSTRSWRYISSSAKGEKKWPLIHPNRRRLQNLKSHLNLARDELLARPPPLALIKKHDGKVSEPTREQLRVVTLHASIPFVGFGIMDNGILILAGEAIDTTVGVTLGISTMCAAAIGNIISDICGVAFGTVIEDTVAKFSKRFKIPPMPKLTHEQRNLRSVRFSNQFGCALGLTIGCIIGMFPLLFFEDEKNVVESKPHDSEDRSK